MSKEVKPGITFYRMDSGHILNKKVRLLVNEFDSDGYYIWCCLLDYAYSNNGYFFDMRDKDELELFASEYCKKKIGLVREVIAGCIRRGLFDENVANLFGILTSEMMQRVFLHATSERRRNGSMFTMYKEYLLNVFSDEIPVNIAISHVTKANKSRDNYTDYRLKTKDLEEPKKNLSKSHSGEKPPVQLPQSPIAKGKRIIRKQPPVEYWDALVNVWFSFYKEHFKNVETGEGAHPDFDGAQGNFLKKIVAKLQRLAEKSNQPWTEETAVRYLKKFLGKGWQKDWWLRENFELSNLLTKFNSITNANNQQTTPANKGTNGSGHGKSSGAIKLAHSLAADLGYHE